MSLRRRELLQAGSGAVLWVACGGRVDRAAEARDGVGAGTASVSAGGVKLATGDDRVLDEILAELHAREPASVLGLSTHAPMVVEALCTLGAGDRAKKWLAGYGGPTLAIPEPRRRIAPDRWRDTL